MNQVERDRSVWCSALYTCPVCGEYLMTDGKTLWCWMSLKQERCSYGFDEVVTVEQHKETIA